MRKYIFFIIFIQFLQLGAQNYKINFSGYGLSNTVDNVEVRNLTQGTKKTLSGSDTLHLLKTIDIDEIKDNTDFINIYPNPCYDICKIKFNNKEEGDVKVELFDYSGKLILIKNYYITKGEHIFNVGGLKLGMFFINFTNKTGQYSEKIISVFNGNSPVLFYDGFNGSKMTNISQTIQMNYNSGDVLLFRGTSGNYIRLITSTPTGNEEIKFNFISSSDIDGNYYPVITIGYGNKAQTWMAENLRTTRFSDGSSIPNIIDSLQWSNPTGPARCWINNDSINFSKWGGLYNYYCVESNLCPIGWRSPTYFDFKNLSDIIGDDFTSGKFLKELGNEYWMVPNSNNNYSGFSAQGAGIKWYYFDYFKIQGYWWTSSPTGQYSYAMLLGYDVDNFMLMSFPKWWGMSVRCISIY